MPRLRIPRWLRFVVVVLVAIPAAPARAADYSYSWVTGSTGLMSNTANWAGNPFGGTPAAGGDTTGNFLLNVAPLGQTTFTLTNDLGAFNLNKLVLNTNTSAGFTFSPSSSSLIFNGSDAALTQANVGNVNSSLPISLAAGANVLFGAPTGAGVTTAGLGNVTLTGIISGSGAITVGNGTANVPPTQNSRVFYLNGVNTFTGGVTLDGGTVGAGTTSASPFGSAGLSVTANGGTWVNTGTISALTGNVTVAAGGTLDLVGTSGVQMGSASLLAGAGNFTTRSTSGLTIQSASTLSGVFTADINKLPNLSGIPGTVTLNGNNGALASVPTFNIRNGGTLALSSNVAGSTPNANRIGDTANVNLQNGIFSLTGTVGGTALTETAANINSTGFSTVTVGVGTTAGATTLALTDLTRTDRGTFLLRGTNLGTAGSNGFITLSAAQTGNLIGGGGAAGTTAISIYPYAVGGTTTTDTGTTFVTYGPTGVRPLATATEYGTTFAGAATDNVRLATSTANNAAVTVNSLISANSTGVTGTGTITVTSGAVLASSTSTITNGLTFPGEGLITTPVGLTVSGPLVGTNGLTKSGSSTLTLSGNNAGLTGTLAVNAGILSFAAANQFPGTGQIVVSSTGTGSAGLTYTGTTPITVSRDIKLAGGFFGPSATGTGGVVTYSGVISGPGGIYYTNTTNNLVLSGNNTFSGPIRIQNGNIQFSSDANLGTGAFDFGNGNTMGIVLTGNWTTSRNINTSLTSGTLTFDTGAFNATLNGPVTNYASGGFGTSSDTIRKSGTGTLTINAPGTLNYGVQINANGGEIRFGNNGAWPATAYTVGTNGTLTADNITLPAGTPATGAVTDRISNNSAILLQGSATLRLIGNASQDSTEILGAVTANTAGANILRVDASGGFNTTLRINNLIATTTLLIRGTNLAGTSGSQAHVFLNQFNSTAVTNGQILANVTAEDLNAPGVVETAVYDLVKGIRLFDPVADTTNGPAIQNAAPTSLAATANFRANPGVANPVPVLDAANTINSLRFAPNGRVDFSGGGASTLTITSGSILTEANATAASFTQAAGSTLTVTAGTAVLAITTNADLTVAATLGGTGGLSKNGAGKLTLNALPTLTGALGANAGTLAFGPGISPTFTGLSGAGAIDLGANSLTITGTATNVYSGALTGTGTFTFAPTAAAQLTLAGNNSGFSGPVVFGANATLTIGGPNALGTGPVSLNNAATHTFTAGTAGVTVPNAFVLPAPPVASTLSFSHAALAQSTTLSGVISGGGTNLTVQFTGPTTNLSNITLTGVNTFVAPRVNIDYGFVQVTTPAAFGDAANVVRLFTGTTNGGGGIRFAADFTGANSFGRTVQADLTTNAFDVLPGFTVNMTGPLTFSASGSGTLQNKFGTGTLIFANANNDFSGAIGVTAGKLLVNGGFTTGTNAVTVSTGATLGGSGSLLRPITLNAGSTVLPGTGLAAETFTTGAVTFNGGVALNTTVGNGGAAVLASTGAFNNGTNGLMTIKLVNDGTLVFGQPYTLTIATFTSTTATTANFTIDPNPTGFLFDGTPNLTLSGTQLQITFVPTPEPATVLGLAAVVLGVGGYVRRRRAAA